MASVFELATLSEMTYDSRKTGYRNWYRKAYYGPSSGKGFYAELYFNRKTKDVVLAIRGTDAGGDEEVDWSDIASDIQIGLGQVPSQFIRAKAAYASVKMLAGNAFDNKYNLYLTGHSLGGGLATLLSATNGGKPTVTFNAPSIQRSFIGSHLINIIGIYKLAKLDGSNILHVRASGDMVSRLNGRHIGKVVSIHVNARSNSKVTEVSYHLGQHSIHNVVKALSTSAVYLKDLKWTSLA